MLIVNDPIICKGFVYCTGHCTDGDSLKAKTEDWKDDGKFTQIFYVAQGSGKLYDETGLLKFELKEHNLYDFKDLYNRYFRVEASNKSCTWIGINPVPASRFFKAELKKENFVVEGEEGKENIIICVKNNIIIENKNLNELNYSRIKYGKKVTVEVPKNSHAIYLVR